MTMEFTAATLVVPVSDWRKGLQWYQQAFPTAKLIDLPEHNFQSLQLDLFRIEIVESDAKLTAGQAGTVLYWQCKDLDAAIAHFTNLGATLYRGPLTIEDGNRICQVLDPFGNLIGLRGP